MPKHYLDYNATAPMRPEVVAVMQELLALPLNPSSVHGAGRRAKQILEDARRTLAEAICAFPNEIVFTASGTEANNWALRAFPAHSVFVSAIEHSSVLKATQAATIPVTADGMVDLSALEKLLVQAKGQRCLVSLMLANNETGIIQPVREAADMVHAHGGLLHCDAVQGVGKIPVDFTALGADLMTISAHKMGGPVGAAALVVKNGLTPAPFLRGGGQELNRRAGTENIAAIAGFAKAVELIDFNHMRALRAWLDACETDAAVIGKHSPRLPNTSCIIMEGISAEVQLIRFDLASIAVSAGSACSSGRIEPSHVLSAMGIGKAQASSAIRISGGWATTREDIAAFRAAWKAFSGAENP